MSGLPDATAAAELAQPVIRPKFIGWLDFVSDEVLATTHWAPVTFGASETGDTDLDGKTFTPIDERMIDVSPVTHRESGSETVTVTLSGLPGLDDALLTQLTTTTNWQGRDARLWVMLVDATGARVGNVWNFYTGTMAKVTIAGSPEGQTITVHIEGYLANFGQASNRTFLDQKLYDSGDLSAAASIAVANGTSAFGAAGAAGIAQFAGFAGRPDRQYEQLK